MHNNLYLVLMRISRRLVRKNTHAEKANSYVCTEREVRRMSQENNKKHSILVWGYQAGPENISRRFRSTGMMPSVVIKAIGG